MDKHSTIILDLTGCKTHLDIHERIKKSFDFPDWFGYSWDAFWDLIRTDVSADKVIIKGEKTLPDNLKNDVKEIHRILDQTIEFTHRLNLCDFSYEVID